MVRRGKLGAVDDDDGGVCGCRDRTRKMRLTRARRAVQKNPTWRLETLFALFLANTAALKASLPTEVTEKFRTSQRDLDEVPNLSNLLVKTTNSVVRIRWQT